MGFLKNATFKLKLAKHFMRKGVKRKAGSTDVNPEQEEQSLNENQSARRKYDVSKGCVSFLECPGTYQVAKQPWIIQLWSQYGIANASLLNKEHASILVNQVWTQHGICWNCGCDSHSQKVTLADKALLGIAFTTPLSAHDGNQGHTDHDRLNGFKMGWYPMYYP